MSCAKNKYSLETVASDTTFSHLGSLHCDTNYKIDDCLMVTKALAQSLSLKSVLVGYVFQMRNLMAGQVNQNYLKHQKGNQSLMPANKCFPDHIPYS